MSRITIRPITAEDGPGLIQLNIDSQRFHAPWVAPATTASQFADYMTRLRSQTTVGFLIVSASDHAAVGVVNLNNVVRGNMQSAALGFYAYPRHAGCGMFSEGLSLVIGEAFRTMKLHRLEANVQPENAKSLACIKQLGFTKEGFSPGFLMVDGAWKDHERWALLETRWPGSLSWAPRW